MSRPVLLDLYCGAGGAARGYHDAGFDIIGVDTKPQPRYPYRFAQGPAQRAVVPPLPTGWCAVTYSEIIRDLRILRMARGLSQENIGARIGVDHACVSNWELGTRYPSPQRLIAWAAALGHDLVLRERTGEP